MNVISLITAIILSQGLSSQDTGLYNMPLIAEKVDKGVLLTWTPAVQTQTSHFEIQRSDDGKNWKAVGIMFPFEDSERHAYQFPDRSLKSQQAYYRIRQVNNSQIERFSEMRQVSEDQQ